MPFKTIWEDPELFLEHNGIRVFHTYKDDDINQGRRCYWLTVSPDCGVVSGMCDQQPCRHVFDARDLSTWRQPSRTQEAAGDTTDTYSEAETQAIKTAVITAIEKGELTPDGRRQPT
jgi:hypothetical protein